MKFKAWYGALAIIVLILLWTLFGKTREGLDTPTPTPGPVTPMVSTEVIPPGPTAPSVPTDLSGNMNRSSPPISSVPVNRGPKGYLMDTRPIPGPLPKVVQAPVPATPDQAMGRPFNLTCTASPVPSLNNAM